MDHELFLLEELHKKDKLIEEYEMEIEKLKCENFSLRFDDTSILVKHRSELSTLHPMLLEKETFNYYIKYNFTAFIGNSIIKVFDERDNLIYYIRCNIKKVKKSELYECIYHSVTWTKLIDVVKSLKSILAIPNCDFYELCKEILNEK